jgi:hypothetical protein
MPEQLYRRCPECRGSESASSCPTCGGKRFIPAGVAGHNAADGDALPWRTSIRTLMLLVALAAIGAYIGIGWVRQQEAARRAEAALARANAESQQAVLRAMQAPAPAGQTSITVPADPPR